MEIIFLVSASTPPPTFSLSSSSLSLPPSGFASVAFEETEPQSPEMTHISLMMGLTSWEGKGIQLLLKLAFLEAVKNLKSMLVCLVCIIFVC